MQTGSSAPLGALPIARDLVTGLFLIAIAAGAWMGLIGVQTMDGVGVGPGLVPKASAVLIAVLGLLIMTIGLMPGAARLERWSIRGPLFVLGSVVVFAVTIRTLGLAIAGPLAVVVSSFADRDSRLLEVLVFAALMSAFCVGLFKYLLRLPVPLAPMLIGY